MASIAVGLSTTEMPVSTFVGAWKASLGLCSTGQVLLNGNWIACNSSTSCFGSNSVVGCLVYLDDNSAFEAWDGVMVNASVTFNVNGNITSKIILPVMGKEKEQEVVDSRSMSNMSLVVPKDEELFPTLTMHSQSRVISHFCDGDIIATKREAIGKFPSFL